VTSFGPIRHLARGVVVFGVMAALASCGSRTGLFGPELLDEIPDATFDVDARDGGVDVRVDSPVDAAIDVIEEPVGCVPGKFTFSLATAQLMFVLDRSGSMKFVLTSDDLALPGQTSRWRALESSLSQTISPFTNQIAMGARFYPSANANGNDLARACIQDPPSVAIAPALGNASKILDVFTRSIPEGGTPTATALALAAQEVSSSRGVARAMVVATDGAPNCNAALDRLTCTCTSADARGCLTSSDGSNCLDDVKTVQTIKGIYDDRNIPVFVIGIGVTGSFASTLDAMAVAGGRPRAGSPRYYAADTPAELTAAFTVVRDSVARCSYITPSSPQDPDAISVEIGGMTIPRDPNHVDGWDWIDQTYGHLQLFGSACTQATSTNVSGTVTCEPPDQ